jgi:hypothetical protein
LRWGFSLGTEGSGIRHSQEIGLVLARTRRYSSVAPLSRHKKSDLWSLALDRSSFAEKQGQAPRPESLDKFDHLLN